jgi:tellurite resistance protein TerC
MPGLELLYVLVMVIFLEGILSIDNAAVLGAMVSVLPEKEMVPWPRPLQFLAQPVHRLLGGQRSAALKVGLLGAYVGRGAMLVLASYVIQNDWLKILGALYLIKLAFENLGQEEPGEAEHAGPQSSAQKGFWSVVLTIELADLAFSIDNVVVVVALSDQLWIILFGVFMGIVTMRFAAGIFTVLIAKEPILSGGLQHWRRTAPGRVCPHGVFRSGQVRDLGRYADPGRGLCTCETAARIASGPSLDRRGHGHAE